MYVDNSVYNTLNSNEVQTIHAMRRFLSTCDGFWTNKKHATTLSLIDRPIRSLLNLIWRNDPFAVDLHRHQDPSVTLFEIQILYGISELRAGNHQTVEELLTWWLPEQDATNGFAMLSTIAGIMDDIGAERRQTDWFRAQIIALSALRILARRSRAPRRHGVTQSAGHPMNAPLH